MLKVPHTHFISAEDTTYAFHKIWNNQASAQLEGSSIKTRILVVEVILMIQKQKSNPHLTKIRTL